MLHAAVSRMRFRWRMFAGAAGVVALAALAGILLSLFAGRAIGGKRVPARSAEAPAAIDATHLPPLLRLPGEKAELRYDIACSGEQPEGGCRGAGTVYLRAGRSGPFTSVPLRFDRRAAAGRYVASVPQAIADRPEGFTYYAVIRDVSTGATATLPAGGAAAPQESLVLRSPVVIDLGVHRFGATRAADARVASASWGDGPTDVGLEDGRHQTPIGASSFDVDRSGNVALLDEAHRRVLRFSGSAVSAQRLAIDGTIADLALAPDGGSYVLESTGHGEAAPLLRRFDAAGTLRASWHAAERTASAVRIGPRGPVTLQYPSSQWMAAAEGASALNPGSQARSGHVGRPLADGSGEVVVYRLPDENELRIAVIGADGIRQAWRIVSDTPIAGVQLAQPIGSKLAAVFATYTDAQSEFEVLVLDGRGVVNHFAVPAADWAETAPLSRFRLAGSSLYQLGSDPSGAFVERYDLGVK